MLGTTVFSTANLQCEGVFLVERCGRLVTGTGCVSGEDGEGGRGGSGDGGSVGRRSHGVCEGKRVRNEGVGSWNGMETDHDTETDHGTGTGLDNHLCVCTYAWNVKTNTTRNRMLHCSIIRYV